MQILSFFFFIILTLLFLPESPRAMSEHAVHKQSRRPDPRTTQPFFLAVIRPRLPSKREENRGETFCHRFRPRFSLEMFGHIRTVCKHIFISCGEKAWCLVTRITFKWTKISLKSHVRMLATYVWLSLQYALVIAASTGQMTVGTFLCTRRQRQQTSDQNLHKVAISLFNSTLNYVWSVPN